MRLLRWLGLSIFGFIIGLMILAAFLWAVAQARDNGRQNTSIDAEGHPYWYDSDGNLHIQLDGRDLVCNGYPMFCAPDVPGQTRRQR